MTTENKSESNADNRKSGLASVDFDVFGSGTAEETAEAGAQHVDFDLSSEAEATPEIVDSINVDFDLFGDAAKTSEAEEEMLDPDATRIIPPPSPPRTATPPRPAPTSPPVLQPVVMEEAGSGKALWIIIGLALVAGVVWWLLR